MANVAAIRIEQARLAEVEQTERILARELEQAAEIQRGLLPSSAPSLQGIDLDGMNYPCRGVGGDYFDYYPYPGWTRRAWWWPMWRARECRRR